MTDREKRAATASATSKSLEAATAGAVVEREPSSSPRKTVGQMRMDSLTYRKYPGQQQVDMSVIIDTPGS